MNADRRPRQALRVSRRTCVRLGGALVAAVLATTVSSCAMHSSDLFTPPQTGMPQSGIRIPAATRYVHRIASEASDVQQAVETGEAGLQSLAMNPDSTDRAAISQLVQLLQQQRADIAAAEAAFRTSTARGHIGAWEAETVLAAHNLKTALGALANYLAEASQAPLTSDTHDLATGSGEWNDAVTHLWLAAGISDPPTL
jgi:hypothetical protein